MKRFWILAFLALAAGCSSEKTSWKQEYLPITEQEKICVQVATQDFLKATPNSLGGHDQDWDVSMRIAMEKANEVCCPLRSFEIETDFPWRKTGVYKEVF